VKQQTGFRFYFGSVRKGANKHNLHCELECRF